MKKRTPAQKRLLAGLMLSEILIAALLVVFFWYMKNRSSLFPWKDYTTIAHAMGSLDGQTYLNSEESFRWYYENGCRMFEADLAETSDGVWVCRHGWSDARGQWEGEEEKVLTAKEFRKARIYGKYTPLTLEALFKLMKEYPDAYVLLDSKNYSERNFENTAEDYSVYVETARNVECEEVLRRVIPEIYSEEMYEGALSVYRFPTYLYSLWKEYSEEELRQIAVFCKEKGIPAASVSEKYWSEKVQEIFDEQGILLDVYTVNDVSRARELLASGAAGICTDTILPEQLEES